MFFIVFFVGLVFLVDVDIKILCLIVLYVLIVFGFKENFFIWVLLCIKVLLIFMEMMFILFVIVVLNVVRILELL